MGDTNATNNKNRTGNTGYTNLGAAYKAKTFILLLIGFVTVAYADTFEMAIIGALTTLSGIGLLYLIQTMVHDKNGRCEWQKSEVIL